MKNFNSGHSDPTDFGNLSLPHQDTEARGMNAIRAGSALRLKQVSRGITLAR